MFTEKPIWKSLGVFNSVGSFKASASSMLDYLEAQLEPRRTKLREALENSQRVLHEYKGYNLGYGWFVFNENDVDTYWHNGSTSGFVTDAYFVPEQDKALIIFNNLLAFFDIFSNILYLFFIISNAYSAINGSNAEITDISIFSLRRTAFLERNAITYFCSVKR